MGSSEAPALPVMFVFGAPWSEVCRRQITDARAVARQVAGRAEVYMVDIDASRQVAGKLDIHSIPTVIVFDGAVERARFIGLQPIQTLIAALYPQARPHPFPRPFSCGA